MRKHPVRTFFGLFILYSAVIVGIFVLQFKTDSVISRTIGALHLSMAQTETDSNIMELRNQLQANFKGISFAFDDSNPVMQLNPDGTEEKLFLSSWEEDGDSATFSFSNGSRLSFSVGDSSSELLVTAETSPRQASISVPYKTLSSYTIDSATSERIILSAKDSLYAFSAPEISATRVTFQNGTAASFAGYDPSKKFSFEMAAHLSGADEASYGTAIKSVRNAVVTKVSQILTSADVDSVSEKQVVAYVAEMAANSRYGEALDAVPDSFKRGNKRTYFSSPYFNNLANMNRSLVMQTEKFSSMVDSAISDRNLEIFTIDGIADYILRIKKTSRAAALLNMPSTIPSESFKPTLSQASAIITVYCHLASRDARTASYLENILDRCLETITDCFQLNETGDNLSISENGIAAGTLQQVLTGEALVEYGRARSMDSCSATGYFIVSRALSSAQSLDAAMLADLYPVLAYNNTFYPHTEILGYYGSKAVWAWTCANSITYRLEDVSRTIEEKKAPAVAAAPAEGELAEGGAEGAEEAAAPAEEVTVRVERNTIANITIDFPLNNTHYIIFNGIPTFHSRIEIQNIMFRTDPRFETYNSSGYVYQSNTETLFIKSRHKSRMELIRLFCDPATNFTEAAQ